ncbi:proline-rich protein 36 isoform X1 [Patagioenas fasciata]|uniref:proline-rich protein 36 isoform X1 n=1 Tax=Patagioenas fasciata TaxID=372321 RepID=UPI003A98EF98
MMLHGNTCAWGPPGPPLPPTSPAVRCPQSNFAWLPLPPHPSGPRPLQGRMGEGEAEPPPGALSEYETMMATLGSPLEEELEPPATPPLPPLEPRMILQPLPISQAEGVLSLRFLSAILGPPRDLPDLAAVLEEDEEKGKMAAAAGRLDPPNIAPVVMETPPPPKMAAATRPDTPKMADAVERSADPPKMAPVTMETRADPPKMAVAVETFADPPNTVPVTMETN